MSRDHTDARLEPGEPHWVMPARSRFAGEPVDASSRRSIQIVPTGPGGELIGADDRHVTVDHFFHEGEFWRGVIPLDATDQVFGQSFNFSQVKTRRGISGPEIVLDRHGLPKRKIPFLNHLQSRFTLRADRPIRLFPLGGDTNGAPTHEVHDFIYTLEALGPLGTAFNLRDAIGGNFISAHRVLSIQEMVFERMVVENEYVTESPPLPLSTANKRSLLLKTLLRSHAAAMSETYYLYRLFGTNNCTSNPFQILDEVVQYTFAQRIGSALYRLPFNPRLYLRVRGLDSDPSDRKLVRHEFEAYIRAPDTQRRKKEYVRNRRLALSAARNNHSSETDQPE